MIHDIEVLPAAKRAVPELKRRLQRYGGMRAKPHRRRRRRAPGMLATGADAPMTPDQAVLLRQLAIAAYEPDAFCERMTQRDAERCVAMLRAKLKRIGEPPLTL